ncbi:hypothetical protein ACQ4WX_48070 [Streptomyces lasalocidi]
MRDCWDIGEQEAGLGLLVAGLLAHQLPISETARAQISVLAETWGERSCSRPDPSMPWGRRADPAGTDRARRRHRHRVVGRG